MLSAIYFPSTSLLPIDYYLSTLRIASKIKGNLMIGPDISLSRNLLLQKFGEKF